MRASAVDPQHFTDRPDDLTVGLLGGMGPLATAELFSALVRGTPADKDWNHLHILVDNNPRMPSRSRAFLFGEASPVPYLVAGARRLLAAGAQLLVVPCNSAAYFLQPVRDAAGAVPVLDPVQATAAVIVTGWGAERPPRAPLVLGGMVTYCAQLYSDALAGSHVQPRYPSEEDQREVIELIEQLKAGAAGAAQRVEAVVQRAVEAGADSVILGCTELTLVAGQLGRSVPVYDSTALLARRTLELARPRL